MKNLPSLLGLTLPCSFLPYDTKEGETRRKSGHSEEDANVRKGHHSAILSMIERGSRSLGLFIGKDRGVSDLTS